MKIIFEDNNNSVRTINYNESSMLKTLEYSKFSGSFGEVKIFSILVIDDTLLLKTDPSNYKLVKKIAYEINKGYAIGDISYNLNDRWKGLLTNER